ncbi:MAG: hypothetical protein U0175_27390 [Caldilineaceae bacterium]
MRKAASLHALLGKMPAMLASIHPSRGPGLSLMGYHGDGSQPLPLPFTTRTSRL